MKKTEFSIVPNPNGPGYVFQSPEGEKTSPFKTKAQAFQVVHDEIFPNPLVDSEKVYNLLVATKDATDIPYTEVDESFPELDEIILSHLDHCIEEIKLLIDYETTCETGVPCFRVRTLKKEGCIILPGGMLNDIRSRLEACALVYDLFRMSNSLSPEHYKKLLDEIAKSDLPEEEEATFVGFSPFLMNFDATKN